MWGMVVLFHVNFSLMIHTVSIWLTLSLAIWRYIMIKYHSLAQSLCTVRRCKIVLLLGYGTDRNALFKTIKKLGKTLNKSSSFMFTYRQKL